MTLEDLKNHFVNSNQFELATGISHVNWLNWFGRYGYIPIGSQQRIEKATGGTLKASLEHLTPQIEIKGK